MGKVQEKRRGIGKEKAEKEGPVVKSLLLYTDCLTGIFLH